MKAETDCVAQSTEEGAFGAPGAPRPKAETDCVAQGAEEGALGAPGAPRPWPALAESHLFTGGQVPGGEGSPGSSKSNNVQSSHRCWLPGLLAIGPGTGKPLCPVAERGGNLCAPDPALEKQHAAGAR